MSVGTSLSQRENYKTPRRLKRESFQVIFYVTTLTLALSLVKGEARFPLYERR